MLGSHSQLEAVKPSTQIRLRRDIVPIANRERTGIMAVAAHPQSPCFEFPDAAGPGPHKKRNRVMSTRNDIANPLRHNSRAAGVRRKHQQPFSGNCSRTREQNVFRSRAAGQTSGTRYQPFSCSSKISLLTPLEVAARRPRCPTLAPGISLAPDSSRPVSAACWLDPLGAN